MMDGLLCSEEAEQSVLGACLLDGRVILDAVTAVRAEDFYVTRHRALFETMRGMSEAGVEIDTITLAETLRAKGLLDAIGGVAYLAELVLAVPSAANWKHYAATVADLSRRRALRRIAGDLAQKISADESTTGVLEWAEREIFRISGQSTSHGFSGIAPDLARSLAETDAASKQPVRALGIPSGFAELDMLTTGWHPGNLVIVGARPSMGKTAFAMQCAVAAGKAGRGVAVASLEMSRDELARRMLSSESHVEGHRLRTGRLLPAHWAALAKASSELEPLRLVVNDSGSQTLATLRSQLRQYASRHRLDLVIVDYLQLIPTSGRESRQLDVSEISRGLKLLAKELHVAVLALSQLSRKCEERTDKRPMLSDLRESGGLEQDADVVIMLYRDEVYDTDTEKPGIAEVIVRKQRNGPVGMVEVPWDAASTSFRSQEYETGVSA